ncbi:hypothetical protein PoB_000404500 [Plakobranchus ocellatus]|uniref:Uncharacterized protein n=1 Tax=Plakobranchus ocellatus TaxID=259542 RepID=A0AAV3Y3D6_9GAST|nr:hypothetical protein PoB_000404500 [Plakobranchus ocellatus]
MLELPDWGFPVEALKTRHSGSHVCELRRRDLGYPGTGRLHVCQTGGAGYHYSHGNHTVDTRFETSRHVPDLLPEGGSDYFVHVVFVDDLLEKPSLYYGGGGVDGGGGGGYDGGGGGGVGDCGDGGGGYGGRDGAGGSDGVGGDGDGDSGDPCDGDSGDPCDGDGDSGDRWGGDET